MTKAIKKKPLSPMNARTLNELCSLQRDNWAYGDFWIMVDGNEVVLAAQKHGESATGSVSIPRRHFKELVQWYMRDQERS